MAVVTVIDNTTAVQFTIDGRVSQLPKPFKMDVEGNYLRVLKVDGTTNFVVLYSDVTAPVVASAELLQDAIMTMFNATPVLPLGAATEATLQMVLAAVNGSKDFEANLVKDTGNNDLVVLQIITYDQDSGIFNPPIYFTTAGAPYTPLGVVVYIDNSQTLAAILLALGTLAAQDSTLQATNVLLTAIDGKDFATQVTSAAILAKLIAAPATEAKQDTIITNLSNILSKIIAAPATEAKQDAGNASLVTIAGKDFATQTTLIAILAKLIAAPATEAKQDTIITNLVAILAKIIASPATEAKQDAEIVLLTNLDANTKRGANADHTSVVGSAVSVTLKASNAGRITLTIYNDSTSALYVKLGATATASDFAYKLFSAQTLVIKDYTGRVDGIWDTATGNARVTEVTA